MNNNQIKFVGNSSHIVDWQMLIHSLEKQTPEYIGPRHDVGMDIEGIDEVGVPIRQAGYKHILEGGNMGWDMFIPGKQFDEEIVIKLIKWLGMDSYVNAWISRVHPGNMAPWHWDVTDDEITLSKVEHRRFHVHMSQPQPGHVFILDNQILYGRQQGDTFEWPSRKSWHAGANAGLVAKYQFNIWG